MMFHYPRQEWRLQKPIEWVNAVRRMILSSLPHSAIDHVHVECNQTFHNSAEFIHMLQLVPIRDCPDQPIDLLLDLACPDTETMIPVCSEHIQVLTPCPDSDTLIRPHVFLFWLQSGQRVRIRAQTSRGIPHQHARYQIGFAGYRILPNVILPSIDIEDLVSLCPRKVFGAEFRPDRCTNCGECASAGVKVEPTDNTLFFVESNVESPVWVLSQSLEILRDASFALLEELKEERLFQDQVVPDTWCFQMQGAAPSMTLAQLLVFELSKSPHIIFHAAKTVHPLHGHVLLRLRGDATHNAPAYLIECMRDACLTVGEKSQEWLDEVS